jgi:tetratricopeptide (TPR) repeat protein
VGSLAFVAALAVGAVQPVPFEGRGHDVVVMNGGEILKGTLMSDPAAATVRIRELGGGGVKAFSKSLVRRIEVKQTLEQAHDEVAASIAEGDHERWLGLAMTCLQKRPPLVDRAEQDLQKSIRAQPAHGSAHALLAEVLLKRHRATEALASAEKAIALAPGDDRAFIVHGRILLELGRDARESIARALAIRPSVEAQLAMARAEIARGRYASAEKAVEAAARLAPNLSDVQTVTGDIQLARGRLDEAEVAYRTAAERGGFGVDDARRGLAAVQFLQGRYGDAESTLLNADQSDPGVTYLQGLIKLGRGEAHHADARKLLTTAAAGGVSRAYLGLGTHIYNDLFGDVAAARAEFAKAVTANEGDAYALLMTAWCDFQLKRFDAAAAACSSAAKLAPESAMVHAASGAAALASGSHAEAVRRYRAGLDSCPDDGALLAGLGVAQLSGGDTAAAAKSFGKALAAGYRGPDVYIGHGYLQFLSNKYASAAEQFTAALSACERGDARTAAYVTSSIARLHAGLGRTATVLAFDAAEVDEPFRLRDGPGVKVVAADGRLEISGKLERDVKGGIGLDTAVDAGLFRTFAADIIYDRASATVGGVRLESMTGGVELARTATGGAVYRARDGKDAPFGQWHVLAPWPASGRMRLEVELVESQRGLARVAVRARDTTPAAEATGVERVLEFKESIWRERGLTVGIFAMPDRNAPMHVVADNVVLVQQTPQ